ncbi:membrane protein [Sphingomonas gellani]|uniref:Membrane protein n=2 Tax=Sphingomonas gellani TaxID=1166340 RepID=A0A1H8CE84_9SPHN|nr:membrane protein [Sphingomonas gellani]
MATSQASGDLDNKGRDADSPWHMPLSAWKTVLWRTWTEAGNDNVGLIAAGVAFYGFLAIVPVLASLVLVYGLIASPQTVIDNVRSLADAMPRDAAQLVGDQLMTVVKTSDGKKGFGLLLALALALFGARNGAGSVITALNVAYEEREKRNFLWVNLLAIGITGAAVLIAIVAILAITMLAKLQALLPGAPDVVLVVGKVVSYLLMTLAGAAGAAALYRFGPSRQQPRWQWLSAGSLFAAIGWLLLTLGFGIYVANFGNYNATYGSLGAVVVLLTWLYLSSYILMFGAELNAELEHQTKRDTTTGRARPLGERGAWVADHVAGEDAPPPPAPAGATPASEEPAKAQSHSAEPIQGGMGRDYLTLRVTARTARLAGMPKVGMAPAALATLGLSLLKRRERALPGIAVLASAAGLAWLGGESKRPDADVEPDE